MFRPHKFAVYRANMDPLPASQSDPDPMPEIWYDLVPTN